MPENEMPPPGRKPDTTDYKDRSRKNLIAGVTLIALLVLSIYAAKIFHEKEKLQRCLDSGRRNCVDLDIPPREGVYVPPAR